MLVLIRGFLLYVISCWKFVKLEILSTSFIDLLYEELGELRSRSLELKFVNLEILSTSFIDFLYEELEELRS